jgi:hypothetical protein
MNPVPRELKVVGRRRPASGAAAAEGILRLVRELREGQLFIPRGVYRFKSFEEAQEWSMKMMARRSNRERPRSTT